MREDVPTNKRVQYHWARAGGGARETRARELLPLTVSRIVAVLLFVWPLTRIERGKSKTYEYKTLIYFYLVFVCHKIT